MYLPEYSLCCTGAIARPNAAFGQGTGPIYYDDMRCTGFEYRLHECSRDGGIGRARHNCQHSKDAGVNCIQGSVL